MSSKPVRLRETSAETWQLATVCTSACLALRTNVIEEPLLSNSKYEVEIRNLKGELCISSTDTRTVPIGVGQNFFIVTADYWFIYFGVFVFYLLDTFEDNLLIKDLSRLPG